MNALRLTSLLLIVLLPGLAWADKSPTASNEGYAWADGADVQYDWIDATDGTLLLTAADDDEVESVLLPFPFTYFGKTYATVYVSENGYLTFHNYGNDPEDSFPIGNEPNKLLQLGDDPDSLIAVFWDDLDLNLGEGGGIYVKTVGNSPFRKFVVQYDFIRLDDYPEADRNGPLTFQVILYESTNLIKFQYRTLGGANFPQERGADANVGLRMVDDPDLQDATIADSLAYGQQEDVLSEGLAILYYPRSQLSVLSATFNPSSVSTDVVNRSFDLRIEDLTFPSSPNVDSLGKADRVKIGNPFAAVGDITVSAIWVDGVSYFLTQSTSPPDTSLLSTIPNLATWSYNTGEDSLLVQLPAQAAVDSIRLRMAMSIPGTAGPYTFGGRVWAALEPGNAADINPQVDVSEGAVSRYTITPTTDSTLTAGDTRTYTVTALDADGNPVSNSDAVTVTAVGSSTATFDGNATPWNTAFAASNTLQFDARDVTAGAFAVRVTNVGDNSINVQSGLNTVVPAAAATLTKVSGDSSDVTAGTSLPLTVRLSDSFGNVISGAQVNFAVTGGGGSLNFASRTTNAAGEATVLLTTGNLPGANTVSATLASNPLLTQTFTVNTVPASISYLTAVPSATSATAGDNIDIVVTAYDANDNVVSSDNSTFISIDSTDATGIAIPINQQLSAGTTTFSIADTVAETFRLTAFVVGDTDKSGTTVPITISPAAAAQIAAVTGDGASVVAGSDQLLQAEVRDTYGNLVPNEVIAFAVINGGGALSAAQDASNGLGIAEATLTTGVTAGSNPARAYIDETTPTAADSVDFTVTGTSGAISYYTVSAAPSSVAATDPVTVTVTAYDGNDNVVTTAAGTNVVLSYEGASRPGPILPAATQALDASGVLTYTVSDSAAGESFRLRAITQGNAARTGLSNLVTVTPGTPAALTVLTPGLADTTIAAGGNTALRVRLDDGFGNPVASGTSVRFAVLNGSGGTLGASNADSLTRLTDGDGIAATTFFSDGSIGTAQVDVRFLGSTTVRDTITVTTTPSAISYFTVTPATLTPTAGSGFSVTVAAFDVNDNPVTTDSETQVALKNEGGTGVTFGAGGDSLATLSGGTATFTVTDTVAESFRLRAEATANRSRTGVSDIITVSPAAAASLVKFAELDNQSAAVGQTLARDIEVQVRDVYGNPVSGQAVQFVPTAGSVADPAPVSDADGFAATAWTLGSTAGTQTLDVFISGVDAVQYTATAVSGNADTLVTVGSTTQTGTVNTLLSQKFTVQVNDVNGNPVQGQTINFVIVSRPSGAINDSLLLGQDVISTDVNGQAQIQLHLGTRVGDYIVRAFTGVTTPNHVDFTGTATAAAADSILIVSGNNQSGTVGQTLVNPLIVRVVDPFENPVSGTTVTFTPGAGSVSPTSDVSDASGLAQTDWTLGTSAGAQQLTASATGLTARTFDATATAGAATTLSLVSLRGITQDSVAALRNQNVGFVIEATDADGNPVSGATVTFAPAAGFSASFEASTAVTGSDGRISNRVRTAASGDSTFFDATLSGGVDVLPVHLYHLSYVAASLTPASASPGDSPSFAVDVSNPSARNVELATGTVFEFDDGASSFSAALSTPAIVSAGGQATLTFPATLIDAAFSNAAYTPVVNVTGNGIDSLLTGDLRLTSNALSLQTVSIDRILAAKTNVSRNEVVSVSMEVDNLGPQIVTVDAVDLVIPGIPAGNIVASGSNPTSLAANSTTVFDFSVTIPATASGTYVVDGTFTGTTAALTPVSDSDANTTVTLTVLQSAQVVFTSLSPDTVTSGDAATFAVTLYNDGDFDVILNRTATFLNFGSDAINPVQIYTIPGGGSANAVVLEFSTGSIATPSAGTTYAADLVLSGTENTSFSFDTTLTGVAAIRVQNPPRLEVADINVVPTTVSEGQQAVETRVVLANTGGAFSGRNATAVIASASDVYLTLSPDSSVFGEINPTGGTFPITLDGNGTSDTLVFFHDIPAGYGAQTDVARVRAAYRDANTGTAYRLAPQDTSDSYDVISRAQLALVPGSVLFAPDTVTRAQSSTLTFDLTNSGAAAATVAQNDLTLSFNNAHTITPVSPAFPVSIPGGGTQTFTYTVTAAAASAIGPDPLDIAATYTDQTSGNSYSDLSESNVDTLQIVSGAGPTTVVIQQVSVPREEAVQGQTGIAATMRIANQSDVAVSITDADLSFDQAGLSYTPQTALPLTIAAGGSATFSFLIDVGGAVTPGDVTVDGSYSATDLVNLGTFSGSGAVVTDVITIRTPATFAFSNVSVTPDTASPGQTGLRFRATVTNGDANTAEASLSSLNLLFTPDNGDLSETLLSPALPTILPGGQSTVIEYAIDVSEPATAGDIDIQVAAGGTDRINDDAPVSATSGAAVLTIAGGAAFTVDNVAIVPDSAVVGQTGVEMTVTVRNSGDATARLDNVMLRIDPTFDVAVKSNTLPQTLAPGASADVIFVADVAGSLNPPPAGTAYPVGGSASGVDVASGVAVSTIADSLDSLIVVDRVDLAFTSLDSPSIVNTGDTVDIALSLTNQGGGFLELDANTFIRLELASDPSIKDSIDVDALNSDLRIGAGESASLRFFDNASTFDLSGEYHLYVESRGTVYTKSFTETVDTDQIINVGGGQISIRSIDFTQDPIAPGGMNDTLVALVENTGAPATIDPGYTLEFRYTNNDIAPINATRIDTLTQTRGGGAIDTLLFVFDVPTEVLPGQINATLTLSFDGGAIGPISRTGSFTVSSGIQIAYAPGTLTPTAVVQGEVVTFQADFRNDGSTNFVVHPDSSFITFTDGVNTFRAAIFGTPAIPGTDFGEVATPVTLTFVPDTIPAAFATGLRDVRLRLFGEFPTGAALNAFDSTLTAALTVSSSAVAAVDSIDIVPTAILAGQDSVAVRYYLSNSGGAPISVTAATSSFLDAADAPVTSRWVQQSQSKSFPFAIAAGDTAVLVRRFIVAASSDPGTVRSLLSVNYTSAGNSFTIPAGTPFDSVAVRTPSTVRVAALNLENTPNAANQRVNTGQVYDLRLTLQNSGGDSLTQVIFTLFDDNGGGTLFTDTVAQAIAPNSTLDSVLTFTAPAFADTIDYRVRLDGATSVTNGEGATLVDALDNQETVFVQTPTRLALSGAGGGTYVLDSLFTISYDIARSGQSPFSNDGQVEIILPTGYVLDPGTQSAVQGFSAADLSGSWQVRGTTPTAGIADSIRVAYLAPLPTDLNTNATVATDGVDTVALAVRVDPLGTIATAVQIDNPAGALDGTVSTGQEFTLSNDIAFSASLLSASRQTELQLPNGFTLTGGQTTYTFPLPGSGPLDTLVTWTVQAPGAATSGDLVVVTRGTDQNTGTQITVRDTVPITVQPRARLDFDLAIAGPAGALDRTVSTGQAVQFDVSLIRDPASAPLVANDSSRVTFDLSGSMFYADSNLTQQALTFGIFPDATVPVTLYAGATATSQTTVRGTLTAISNDANLDADALVDSTAIPIVFTIVDAALLSVDINGPVAAGNGTPFDVTVSVANAGDAALVPNSVAVTLSYDPLQFQRQSGTSDVFNVTPGGTVPVTFLPLDSNIVGTIAADISADAAVDENSGAIAARAVDRDSITVNVVASEISVISAAISAPAGAQDGTVSSGQVFTVSAAYSFGPTIDSTSYQAEMSVPAGYAASEDTISLSAASGLQQWSVTAPAGADLPDVIEVFFRGMRSSDGLGVEQSRTVPVETQPRAALSVNAALVAPDGATDGVVSTGQDLTLRVGVSNAAGAAGTTTGSLNTVRVTLPAGYAFSGGGTISTVQIATDDSTDLTITAPGSAASAALIRTELTAAAPDSNRNAAADIVRNRVDTSIRTVARANLVTTLTVSDTVVSTGQSGIAAVVQIRNTGTAGVSDDSVTTNLSLDPTRFAFDSGDGVQRVPFVNGLGEATYLLTALGNAGVDTLVGSLVAGTLQDENDNAPGTPVTVSVASDSQAVEILPAGMVTTVLTIAGPAGALDSTVSTGQEFDLENAVAFAGAILPASRQTRIELPQGFALVAGAATQTFPGSATGTASWTVRAPAGAASGDLIAVTSGTDQNTGATVTMRDTVSMTVQPKARLAFSAGIAGPAGALDRTVSTGQPVAIDLRLVRDPATAPLVTDDSSAVTFDLTGTGFFADAGQTQETATVAILPDDTVQVTLYAGPGAASQTIVSGLLTDISFDANLLDAADVSTDSVGFVFTIIDAALLSVDVSGPVAAGNGDPFDVAISVSNAGDADVVPNSVAVTLSYDATLFQRQTGTSDVINVTPGGTIPVTFLPLQGDTSGVIGGDISADGAVDENSGAVAAKNVDRDSITVNVVTSEIFVTNTGISGPAGALDGTVSSGQVFTVSADYSFGPTIDPATYRARLEVPSGYAASEDLITLSSASGTQQWSITAPDSQRVDSLITVRFFGTRGSDGVPLDVPRFVSIETQNRAALSVDAALVAPSGAADGVVSTTQTFTLRVGVSNEPGAAGTTTGSLNTLRVTLPAVYAFSGGGTVRNVQLTTGDSSDLVIIAPGSAASAALIRTELTTAAPDSNRNAAADILRNRVETSIRTVARANLVTTLTVSDTVVSTGQSGIAAVVEIRNTGTAGVNDDSVTTNLAIDPALFAFEAGDSVQTVPFVNGLGEATYLLSALGSTGSDIWTGSLVLNGLQDENDNAPGNLVTVSDSSDSQPVSIQEAGAITSVLTVTGPAGALDSTVSTGQEFTLENDVSFAGAILPATRRTRLEVPQGFAIVNGAATQEFPGGTSGTANWTVQAAADSVSDAPLVAVTTGTDQNTGSVVTVTDTLRMTVQQAARLLFSAAIDGPAGATDRTVSTRQQVDLRFDLVQDSDRAPLVANDSTTLLLDLSGTGFYGDAGFTQDTVTISLLPDASVIVPIFAGPLPVSGSILSAALSSISADANTLAPAAINTASIDLVFSIVERALLSVSLTGPGSVGLGNEFDMVVSVENAGTAGIDPDSVDVQIAADPIFIPISDPSGVVRIAPGNSALVTFRSDTPDGSGDISVDISGDGAVDENSGQIAAKDVTSQQRTVSVVANDVVAQNFRIVSPAGAQDGTFSSGQVVTVAADYSFGSTIDPATYRAALSVPSGYVASTDPISLNAASGTQTWSVTAPDSATSALQNISARFFGFAPTANDTLEDIAGQLVRTLPRTALAVDAAIVAPDGAVDGVVSTGQALTLRVGVRNAAGAAGTTADSLNTVDVTLPSGYAFSGGGTSTTVQLATDDSTDLTVTAPGSAASAALIRTVLTAAAPDSNRNVPAAIVRDRVETSVRTVSRASLVTTLTVSDTIVSTGQEGILATVRIRNGGTAGVSEDSVTTRLDLDPALFAFADTLGAVRRVPFANGLGEAVFPLTALGNLGSTELVGRLVVGNLQDENDNAPGTPVTVVSDSAVQAMEIQEGALVATDLVLTGPAGALDSTVSTGQTFSLRADVTFAGVFVAGSRQARIELPTGFALVSGTAVVPFPGGSGSASWTVQAPAAADTAAITVISSGTDANTGSAIANADSVTMIVQPAARLAFSAALTNPQSGVVSTFQEFDLSLDLSQVTGTAPLADEDAVIRVDLTGTGFYLNADRDLRQQTFPVRPDANFAVPLWADTVARNATLIRAVLDSIPDDANSGIPAAVNVDSLGFFVEIESRADLAVEIDGPTAVAAGGAFEVTVTVRNNGTAEISPNEVPVQLEFDTNIFTLLSGNPDTVATPGTELIYGFESSTISTGNEIAATIATASNVDNNTGLPAFRSRERDSLSIDVSNDLVRVVTLEISEPAGATDDTLSTGQTFSVSADYFFASQVIDSTRAIRLILPAGFQGDTSPIALTDDNGSRSWVVTAPGTPVPTANLRAEVSGKIDIGGGNLVDVDFLSTLPVSVVAGAQLNLVSAIVDPQGAQDGILSTGQAFSLRVNVRNDGVAGTSGSNSVRIGAPAGYVFSASGNDSLDISLTTGVPQTLTLTAPATVPPAIDSIRAVLVSPAADENSGAPAPVANTNARVRVRTVQRAALAIALEPDFTTVSTNQQNIPVQVLARNLGTAAVNGDSIGLRLAVNPAFFTIVGAADSTDTLSVSLVNGRADTTFFLNAIGNPGNTNLTAGIVVGNAGEPWFVSDENTDSLAAITDTSTTVAIDISDGGLAGVDSLYISAPAGATDDTLSTGQVFTLTAEVSFLGSVAAENRFAEVFLPDGFFLASGSAAVPVGQDNATVNWQVRVSDTLNTTPPAGPEAGPESLRGGASGAGIPGVSGRADRVAGGRETDGVLKRGADAILAALDTMVVEARGIDQNSELPVSGRDSLGVTVEARAALTVDAAIAGPAGAQDGVLSTHQSFDVRVAVANGGVVGTVPDDSNTVVLRVPAGFVIDHPDAGIDSLALRIPTDGDSIVPVFAPVAVPGTQPVITARLTAAAADRNSGTPAFISDPEDGFNLAVVERASLRVDTLIIANRQPVRGQTFSLQARLFNEGAARVVPNDSVTVYLDGVAAGGLELLGEDTVTVRLINQQALATWNLRVSDSAPFGDYTLTVAIDSTASSDENTAAGTPVHLAVPELADSVNVGPTGSLALGAAWIDQEGTTRLRVATGQSIEVAARVDVGPRFSERRAVLYLPGVFPNDSLVAQVDTGQGQVIRWPLSVPQTLTSGYDTLTVRLSARDPQGNLQVDARDLEIDIDPRAVLSIDGRIAAGAVNDRVSRGQAFTFRASVSNGTGAALGDTGRVTLNYDATRLTLENGSAERDLIPGDTISIDWQLRVNVTGPVAALLREIGELEREKAAVIRRATLSAQSVDERGPVMPDGALGGGDLRRIDGAIDDLNDRLMAIVDSTVVGVEISDIPLDSLSGEPAAVARGADSVRVTIEEQPTIAIEPVVIADTWSTGQRNTVNLVVTAPSNVIDRQAVFSSGVDGFAVLDTVKIFTGSQVSYELTAPAAVTGGIAQIPVTIDITGRDRNNPDVVVSQQWTQTLTVQQRSRLALELVTPATLDIVQGRSFQISALVTRAGQSPLNGATTLRLDDGGTGFQFDDDPVQTVSSFPATVTWTLRPPQQAVNSAVFTVGFENLPVDGNDPDSTVQIANNVRSRQVFVTLSANELEVEAFKIPRGSSSFTQGATNVPMFGLRFTNNSPLDAVTIRGLTLSVRGQNENNLATDILNLISRIYVVSDSFYQNTLARTTTPDELGELIIGSDENPVDLVYSNVDEIGQGDTSRVVVLIDLSEELINRSFRLRVDDVDAVDSEGRPVRVVDPNGADFTTQGDSFQSDVTTILSSDPADAFRNYPNPFGMDTQILNPPTPQGVTRFTFVPQSDPVSGELSLYTLTGHLVYRVDEDLSGLAGGQANSSVFTWNGLNGQGERVVNGVYVAVLKLNYVGGGSDTFQTKVVYIK